MVTVHNYEVWGIIPGDWMRQPHKGTEERIRETKGRIVPATAEEVDSSAIDRYGLYDPKPRQG
jgi:hypothetical protein